MNSSGHGRNFITTVLEQTSGKRFRRLASVRPARVHTRNPSDFSAERRSRKSYIRMKKHYITRGNCSARSGTRLGRTKRNGVNLNTDSGERIVVTTAFWSGSLLWVGRRLVFKNYDSERAR